MSTKEATDEKAAEEATAKKATEEAAATKAAEESAAKKAAEESAAKKAAEETAEAAATTAAKKAAQEAAAKKRAEDAAAKKATEEAAAKKAAEEAAAKKTAEEAAVKKAADEAAAKKAADEAAAKKPAEEAAAKKTAGYAAAKTPTEEAAATKSAEDTASKKTAEEAASTKETTAYDSAMATAKKSKANFTREQSPLAAEGADVWNNQLIYQTQVFKDWERLLLLRIVKRIHALLVSNLSKEEELLFYSYQSYDENLDGVVAGEEATGLLRDFRGKATERGVIINGSQEDLADADGTVTFLALLRWFQKSHKKDNAGYMAQFSEMIKTGNPTLEDTEKRLDELTLEGLRRNLVGYRSLLEDVTVFIEEKKLEEAHEAERQKGLVGAAEDYHRVVTNELVDEEQVMFEAFLQVDSSGDLLLQVAEVESLMRRIEPEATQEKIKQYMDDINMEDSDSLTFVDLMQWWYDSSNSSGSVVAEKGQQLLASVKSLAFDNKIDSWITGNWAGKRIWKQAQDRGQQGLEELRDAYIRVMREVRYYKMQLELRKLEFESGVL